MQGRTYSYLFEAKSIQRFIMDSGKLRDLVGASELVDSLCNDPLTEVLGVLNLKVLDTFGLKEELGISFSRRAGGAFYAFLNDKQKRDELAALWSLVVQQYAPGLAFDHAMGEGENEYKAYESARKAMRDNQSMAIPDLPQAGPYIHRSQRTGRPAIQPFGNGDTYEFLDAATLRQRRANRKDNNGLCERFNPDDVGLTWEDWPLDLSPGLVMQDVEEDGNNEQQPDNRPFPFINDKQTIAVVHADGNGMGELLLKLRKHAGDHPEKFIKIFQTFSDGMQTATEKAAKQAVSEILLPIREKDKPLPARPIVLGGDDLTIILRADIAIPFIREFMLAFSQETQSVMDAVKQLGVNDFPQNLTACAGIAYIKSSQPFYLAARLAEGITAHVKRQAKSISKGSPPSSLGFYRVTTAMIDNYDSILSYELTHDNYCDTLGAYALETDQGMPVLDDLLGLQLILQQPDIANGPTRQLLTLINQDMDQAKRTYRRWLENMQKYQPRAEECYLHCMDNLRGQSIENDGLPYWSDATSSTLNISPIGDLRTLIAVDNVLD